MGSLNVFRYPPPSRNRVARTDGSPWCDFHYNVGHDTNDCWTLREQIEQLLKEGRLKQYTRYDRSRSPPHPRREPRQPSRTSPDSRERRREPRRAKETINSIAGGFAGGGSTSSARKRYLRTTYQVNTLKARIEVPLPIISFTAEDVVGILPHEDDPMVVRLRVDGVNVKRVLIDQGSSANILYYDAYQKLRLRRNHLRRFEGTLVGFSNEEVEVLGYIQLEVVFGTKESEKAIPVKFLVINCVSSYNITIGRPAINR